MTKNKLLYGTSMRYVLNAIAATSRKSTIWFMGFLKVIMKKDTNAWTVAVHGCKRAAAF